MTSRFSELLLAHGMVSQLGYVLIGVSIGVLTFIPPEHSNVGIRLVSFFACLLGLAVFRTGIKQEGIEPKPM